jgi:2'-5' RNA ligase
VRERYRLFAAIVLRGEVASRVDGLRMALGSNEIDRLPPHITLAPPVNVPTSALDQVLDDLRDLGGRTHPFACRLGPLATFGGERPVCYLEVRGADVELEGLAAALRSGPLRPPEPAVLPEGPSPHFATPDPERAGRRTFVPHVTVAHRTSPTVAAAAVLAGARFSASLPVQGMSVLRSEGAGSSRIWREIADVRFEPPLVRGRGGIEIDLWRSRLLDPVAGALLPPGYIRSPGEPWAVTARQAGALVGVATGSFVPGVCTIDALVVVPDERGRGWGSRMLEAVELDAAERCADVLLATVHSAAAERYFSGRGYASGAPEIPGTPGVRRAPLRLLRRVAPEGAAP